MAAVTVKPASVEVGHGRLGRGVFATRAIADGEIVEVCPTLEVEDSAVSGTLGDYIFSSNDDEHAVILLLGFGMLYNHAADANCEYVEHGEGLIAFHALRDVAAGEELTINYGADWWDTRDKDPL